MHDLLDPRERRQRPPADGDVLARVRDGDVAVPGIDADEADVAAAAGEGLSDGADADAGISVSGAWEEKMCKFLAMQREFSFLKFYLKPNFLQIL